MDLTRLYNLTTPELREEAERLGVSDTYAMSRGQLIHAIRNQSGSSQPEGLLGKVGRTADREAVKPFLFVQAKGGGWVVAHTPAASN